MPANTLVSDLSVNTTVSAYYKFNKYKLLCRVVPSEVLWEEFHVQGGEGKFKSFINLFPYFHAIRPRSEK